MRVVIERAALRRALRSGQWVFGAAAVAMLGYCGLLLADGWRFQRVERAQFESVLRARPNVVRAALLPPPAVGGLIGRMEIPRLELSVMVVEGADNHNLRHAAGHIRGTGLPGRPGNVGISAHRDTYFRPLRNIRRDDVITFTTVGAAYRYRVVSTKVVRPNDVAVLDSDDGEVLTLVTCYPFYLVGPAPRRFIVRAVRM